MPHTLANLPYQRRVKRGASDLLAVTNMSGMLSQAYQRMSAEPWRPLDVDKPDFPLRSLDISGWLDTYDACNYCGDITAAPVAQKAYAGAVVYSFRLPPDAIAGTPANIVAVEAVLRGNRYLSQGAILAIIPSASPEPPEWEDCRAAAWQSPDPADNEDSPSNWRAPLRRLTRGNDGQDSAWRFRWAPPGGSIAAARYLHCVLRLSDYATHTGAWIEGAALFDASQFEVSTDREVARSTEVLTGFYDNNFYSPDRLIAPGLLNYVYWVQDERLAKQRTTPATTFGEGLTALARLAAAAAAKGAAISQLGIQGSGATLGLRRMDTAYGRFNNAIIGSTFIGPETIDAIRATGIPVLSPVITFRYALYMLPGIIHTGAYIPTEDAVNPSLWDGSMRSLRFELAGIDGVGAAYAVEPIHAWTSNTPPSAWVNITPTRLPELSMLILAVSPVAFSSGATVADYEAASNNTYWGYIAPTAVLSARIR